MGTKPLNRIKADKLALEEKTIQAIEHLTDDEIVKANEELSLLVSQLTGDAFAIKGLEALINKNK